MATLEQLRVSTIIAYTENNGRNTGAELQDCKKKKKAFDSLTCILYTIDFIWASNGTVVVKELEKKKLFFTFTVSSHHMHAHH